MKSQATRSIARSGLFGAVLLLMVGCTSSTRVNFNGPPGSVLTIDDKPHHLPATVELSRPSGGSGAKRHDAGLVFNLPGQAEQHRATGFIDVFAYNESDVDKVAVSTCNLDPTELARIADGTTVIFKGQTASRQPLYELTLSRK